MIRIVAQLTAHLERLIREIGQDGGLISPAVYDTAQGLRFASAQDNSTGTLHWLLSQQYADGGWCDPALPQTRDVPTLAAVLALRHYQDRNNHSHDLAESYQAGITFLRNQAQQWSRSLADDLPVGIELILPRLLHDAAALDISLPREEYATLIALGNHRRELISKMGAQAGTTPTHSWEAWGTALQPAPVDGSGGIGHSPAATSAWVYAIRDRLKFTHARERARQYLREASAATGEGVSGVLPTVWPIARFEQVAALYFLHLAGLLDYEPLHEVLAAQLRDLDRAMGAAGIGMSDYFVHDGDISAMALVVLAAGGYARSCACMTQFARGTHYCAYQGELQASLSVTAHAVHMLAVFHQDARSPIQWIYRQRLPAGYWASDKWHASWYYCTSQIIAGLLAAGECHQLDESEKAFIIHQRHDGGWGRSVTTAEETAFALIALLQLERAGLLSDAGRHALQTGGKLLTSLYHTQDEGNARFWISKELYRPRRLSSIIELATTLALHLRA